MVSAFRSIALLGSPQGAGRDFAKAQKELITINQNIIFTGFYEKIRG